MRALAVFVSVLGTVITSILLGWLSGYNFDERSPDVAAWALFTLGFAAFFGMSAYSMLEKGTQ